MMSRQRTEPWYVPARMLGTDVVGLALDVLSAGGANHCESDPGVGASGGVPTPWVSCPGR